MTPEPTCELSSTSASELKTDPFWSQSPANTGPPRKSGSRATLAQPLQH